ncbi:hypothetical protein [Azospira sp. I13]|uniref:hypothetical protein n=1 Tax=Azospira sp. I13 TaxID=1765050 RepID=UPI000D59DDDB|nr:hypothetical protein [Azospira sp. I13]
MSKTSFNQKPKKGRCAVFGQAEKRQMHREAGAYMSRTSFYRQVRQAEVRGVFSNLLWNSQGCRFDRNPAFPIPNYAEVNHGRRTCN